MAGPYVNYVDKADGSFDVVEQGGRVTSIPQDAPGAPELKAEIDSRSGNTAPQPAPGLVANPALEAQMGAANQGRPLFEPRLPGVPQSIAVPTNQPFINPGIPFAGQPMLPGAPQPALAYDGKPLPPGAATAAAGAVDQPLPGGGPRVGFTEQANFRVGPQESLFGVPSGRLSGVQKDTLETYDVQTGVLAGARDETGMLRDERTGIMQEQAAQLQRDMQQREAERQDAYNYAMQARTRLDDAQYKLNEAINQGVNPNRIFENGTVSRTQAAIAGAIGGAFRSPTGDNEALTMLNRMVDRDLDAQKVQLEARGQQANNLLATYNSAFGNMQAAETAYRISQTNYQLKELDQVASRIDTVEARERANMTIVELQRQKVTLENQFLQQNAAARTAAIARNNEIKRRMQQEIMLRESMQAGGGLGAGMGRAEAEQAMLLQTPDSMLSKEQLAQKSDLQKRVTAIGRDMTNAKVAEDQISAVRDKIMRMQEKYGGDAPGIGLLAGTEKIMAVQQAINSIFGTDESRDALATQAQVKSLENILAEGKTTGVLTDKDWDRMKKALPQGDDTEQQILDKLDGVAREFQSIVQKKSATDPLAAAIYERNVRQATPIKGKAYE